MSSAFQSDLSLVYYVLALLRGRVLAWVEVFCSNQSFDRLTFETFSDWFTV